jgi:hypothetical protein
MPAPKGPHTNVGQVRCQFQRVDKLGRLRCVALDTKRQNTTVSVGTNELASEFVRSVRGKPKVRDPCHLVVLLKPLRESERVVAVPLHTKRQGLEPIEDEEGAKGVEGRTKVAKELGSNLDGERNIAKGFTELESVVSLGRLCEAREFAVLRPVEVP